jgi:hypothetical protein
MKKVIFFGLVMLSTLPVFAQNVAVSLKGIWHYQLDSLDLGITEKWFNRRLTNPIHLPGTLDDAGVGTLVTRDTGMSKNVMLHLSRKYRYIGAAWYQRSLVVKENMTNACLTLERVIWKTDCWIDGHAIGSAESLIAPQVFNLGKLSPGIHQITLRIDNRKQHDISASDMAHAYTDGTQIIWNGIIGKIEVRDYPPMSLENVIIAPSLAEKQIDATVSTLPGAANPGFLKAEVIFHGKVVVSSALLKIQPGATQHILLPLSNIKPWDEFHPDLYQLNTEIVDEKGKLLDVKKQSFGFRTISTIGSDLKINGRPLFLRGTLECNIFPLEGHPPMDAAGWIKVFSTAKNYGLNHIRFHSWCPPEAAFRVADSLGFYLHVELPLWSLTVGKDAGTLKYIEEEARQIMLNYGNHPSFCFWSMGNELEGDFDWLRGLVTKLKNLDKRHLYTTTTFSFQRGHGKSPEPVDDYFITQYTNKGWVRGQGIFNTNVPDFKTDYSNAVSGLPVPLIIHEVGQYSVYPDLSEIPKYTGVLRPDNFVAVQNDLRKKNMLDLAVPYLEASGMLSANLYKEEIERALKTKGVGGFQLLDLHDFPGQGTALVGLLNAFWDSKGIITPEEFRAFCAPVVPLLRFEKGAYTNDETFNASAEIANYSDKPVTGEFLWSITTNHQILFGGSFGQKTLAVGNGEKLGNIAIDLHSITHAAQLEVTVKLNNSMVVNHWKIWVYPRVNQQIKNNVHFTTSLDSAETFLRSGATVLFNPAIATIHGIDGRFAPVFWSPVHFPDQPGSMGLLIDYKHPALADFPTSYFSDWQWWDLVTHSRSLLLDNLGKSSTPIVRVIDNFFKNRNLGLLLEYRVGKGKLLLCTMDISNNLQQRPEARQLRYSLLNYAAGQQFHPGQDINEKELQLLLNN